VRLFVSNQNISLSLEQLCNRKAVSSQPLYKCSCVFIRHYTTFATNSVFVVAISHILSSIYLNSNESSAGNPGCNGGILIKIHNFHCGHTSTKYANMVAIGKLLRAPT